eukprot:Rmarinus@m.16335
MFFFCSHSLIPYLNDVRRENVVLMEDVVKFIDLDRVCEASSDGYDQAPGSIFYPLLPSASSIDWYQLGLSLLLECGVNIDEIVMRSLAASSSRVLASDAHDEVIVRTICSLGPLHHRWRSSLRTHGVPSNAEPAKSSWIYVTTATLVMVHDLA